MLNKREILAFLRDKKDDFFSEFQVVKLGLFGSFARDEATLHSDIDLIIEFKQDTDQLFDKKLMIKSIVKEQFNREVDICREKFIKPYFKEQILKSAIYV